MYSKEIENSDDKKEQLEVLYEIEKIYKYKNELQLNNYKYDEIQKFITDVINKYRYKIEVKNFYNAPVGQDIVSNQYDTLCVIEQMICQYAVTKGFKAEK